MSAISRRHFLRNASVGAATVGVVAVGGTTVLGAITNAGAAPSPLLSSASTPTLQGSDVFAHVVDARTGQMSIFVGTRQITFTNHDLAQQLLRAAQ